jgi:hypothetical protein
VIELPPGKTTKRSRSIEVSKAGLAWAQKVFKWLWLAPRNILLRIITLPFTILIMALLMAITMLIFMLIFLIISLALIVSKLFRRTPSKQSEWSDW